MPIGVPRIIYCWGEELPAQWTDIYNFIFRRRMVFLMQYLDDELCNQICGLLINIHMEDRSKELEKKETDFFKGGASTASADSGLFKNSQKSTNFDSAQTKTGEAKKISINDLLKSEDDIAIDQNYKLEQYTLQKITMEWLNWNAQFLDYSDEPYMFYLAELLSKSFNDSKDEAQLLFNAAPPYKSSSSIQAGSPSHFDVYSPFRLLSNMREEDGVLDSLKDSNEILDEKMIEKLKRVSTKKDGLSSNTNAAYSNLLSNIANKDLWNKVGDPLRHRRLSSEKALGQRKLRKEYSSKAALQMDSQSSEFRDYYRKQTERTLLDEESKKVFMIINSFGGSVGNGITVHDALQFIKAGSLTLALGVAASAASLALAGGTIGERYVTEGCHVMIHQPEGGLSGQASDIWIDSQEIMKIRLDVAEIYSLSTYRPRHKILRDLDRDFYLSATETIHYGLADEIASNEIMHEIIEMTSKVWDYHDTKQQRLLESRDSMSSGVDTQTQN